MTETGPEASAAGGEEGGLGSLFALLMIVGTPIWLSFIHNGIGFGFQATLELPVQVVIAGLLGAIGGVWLAWPQRFPGFVAGAVTSIVEVVIAYYYVRYRETIWMLEMVIPLLPAAFVGFLLYGLLGGTVEETAPQE